MSYKLSNGIVAGQTSVTIPVTLRKTADSTELTGIAYTSVTGSYQRQGAARVAITMATQTVTGAFSSGGFIEIDATNQPGLYRFDIPDAALVRGADFVIFSFKVATAFVEHYYFPLNQDERIYGTFATGTLAIEQATTSLSGYTADQLNRRLLTVLSGSAAGERVLITDYIVSAGAVKWSPVLTVAPSNGDAFMIQ
jgi:hypothetical protein